mmetsp:Transcript_9006/g.21102  ORF Transcript_9006/g.21102 Transcript_9006/m.21102 type:complete len:234 (-) Transcript_9006:4-705(-)
MGVASGGLDLEDAVVDGQEGHVEGAATEIEDEDVALAVSLLVKTVRDGGSSGLVDDAEHVEAGDDTSVLGGLTLRVVEVRGHGHDSVVDLLGEVCLGDLLHLEEHEGRNLLGHEGLGLTLVVDLDGGLRGTLVDDLERPVLHVLLHGGVVETTADEALRVEDGVGRVHGHLVLGSITDQTLLVVEGDIGGSGAVTLVVGDDLDTLVLPDTNTAVRSAEVDADGDTLNFLVSHG